MKINKILSQKYNYDTTYQRDDAWNKKNRNLLIDSIMNDYFIPHIIIANQEVIDGKQRILTIKNFVNNQFAWKNTINNQSKFYKNFMRKELEKFNNKEIEVVDLKNISQEKILETFIRINEGSIKLSKVELRLAKATPENRIMILEIAKNEKIKIISNNKKKDKRFKIEDLITRCIAILHMPANKKGVRQFMNEILNENNLDNQNIIKKSHKTINTMHDILSIDTIPISSFNTIFESIFCAMYEMIESQNAFLFNKEKIKKEICAKIEEISNDQMGGGIKFDSIEFISKRIDKIKDILKKYLVDPKRNFTYDQKLKLWKTSAHVCQICKIDINTINDFQPDHIKPYTIGGDTNLNNARILCKTCNIQEGIKIREKIRIK